MGEPILGHIEASDRGAGTRTIKRRCRAVTWGSGSGTEMKEVSAVPSTVPGCFAVVGRSRELVDSELNHILPESRLPASRFLPVTGGAKHFLREGHPLNRRRRGPQLKSYTPMGTSYILGSRRKPGNTGYSARFREVGTIKKQEEYRTVISKFSILPFSCFLRYGPSTVNINPILECSEPTP